MKVSVVTATKDRPEALSLCKRWVDHQTHEVHEWVVIEGREYREGLVLGAEKAQGDAIVIFDDDDWYSPHYVARIVERMDLYDVVAALWSAPYHIRGRAYNWGRRTWGLSNTLSFKPYLRPLWRGKWERGEKMKDIRQHATACRLDIPLMIPIKGLYPGGMSVLQTYAKSKFPNRDRNLWHLKKAVGDDAVAHYLRAISVIDERLRGRETLLGDRPTADP